MRKISILSILAILFVMGCVGQVTGESAQLPSDFGVREKTASDTGELETDDAGITDDTQDDSETKIINMVAKTWEFIPSTIEVNKGETIKLVIAGEDTTHGIAVPQIGIPNTEIPAGQITEIIFTPEKTGAFKFSCTVFCGSGHSGMTGIVIVNE